MIEQQDLIAGIRRGDRKVIAVFYRTYRTAFFEWASSEHSVNQEDIAEVYQDAVMLIIKHITTGVVESFTHSPWHYLKGVGRNLVLNTARKKQKEALILDSINNGKGVFSDKDDNDDDPLLALIRQCVEEMEMPCKRIIELFYYRGYVIEAIKREMNYKDDAVVRNQKKRCLQYLFKMIKNTSHASSEI